VLRSNRAEGETGEQARPLKSPFATDEVKPATLPSSGKAGPIVGLGGGLEFTAENVDKVLDEVRPYLIADGGNVAVVEVDEHTREVRLRLQGACGSCPSSTTTMKMGIERVLRENFAGLGAVIAVSSEDETEESEKELTEAMVQQSLARVLPAVKAMGGRVEVVSVTSKTVTLRYEGPVKLKQGVELVLKDLDSVESVEFIE